MAPAPKLHERSPWLEIFHSAADDFVVGTNQMVAIWMFGIGRILTRSRRDAEGTLFRELADEA